MKRLAASMVIAARENGFAVKDQDQVVLDTVEAYRTAMASFAAMRNLDVWYARLDIEGVLAKLGPQLTPRMVKRTEKNLAKARARDSMSAFSKLTRVVDGDARIVAEPPLVVPVASYLGKSATFDRAIVEFSHAYAQQNERDYRELVAAVESGRITAETGF